MLRVPVSVVLGLVKLTSLAVNIVVNPWSQIWPMDMRLRLPKAGNMLEIQAPVGNWEKGRREVCEAWIDDPFGSKTRMPLDVEDLFVNGVEGPRKWLGTKYKEKVANTTAPLTSIIDSGCTSHLLGL